MIKPERSNLQSFCRTCLDQLSTAEISKYKLRETPNLTKLLIICTELDIKNDVDEQDAIYPQCLCTKCHRTLQDIQQFRTQAQDTAQKLKDIVNSENIVVKEEFEPADDPLADAEESLPRISDSYSLCSDKSHDGLLATSTEIKIEATLSDDEPANQSNAHYIITEETAQTSSDAKRKRKALECGYGPAKRSETDAAEAPQRRRYSQTSQQDRASVVAAALRGDDWVSLATSLGVIYKTAWTWVKSGRIQKFPRGGNRPKKLTKEHIDIVVSWIEASRNLTAKEIVKRIQNEFNITVAPSTVGNYLDGMLYSYKNEPSPTVTVINSSANRERRAAYVTQLINHIQNGKRIVWIGDINFNFSCRLNIGRPRLTFTESLPNVRDPGVQLIGAISACGVVTLDRQRSNFFTENSEFWINTLLLRWQEQGNDLNDLCIVCDSMFGHQTLEAAVAIFSAGSIDVLRLPQYSSWLNPLETIWSKIRIFVKGHMSQLDGQKPTGATEQRLQYLERFVDEAKAIVTDEVCASAVQQSTTFYADAMGLSEMTSFGTYIN